jgi:glycosyltransferase involved in cell wall biosynthesis
LSNQSFKNFEVLVVLKPSGDGTETAVNKFQKKLNIRVLNQKQGYVLDALNLGLANAKGEIIIFLDDDAIPFPDLIQRYVAFYKSPKIGGVAGDVFAAGLNDPEIVQFKDKPSCLVPPMPRMSRATKIGLKLWNRPLEGQENYLFYISKAGVASMNPNVARLSNPQSTLSLLGRGANMSVHSSAVEGFRFPTSWILGFTWEQYLGWYIWKKGYHVVFSPQLKVYHLEHGQSLSRGFQQTRRETILYTEQKLLFYRLYGAESNLSLMHRTVWLGFESIIDLKRICVNKELHRIARLKSTFYSEVIGFKWIVCKLLGLEYSPLSELKSLQ